MKDNEYQQNSSYGEKEMNNQLHRPNLLASSVWIAILLGFLTASSCTLLAQSIVGSIGGIVTDASGAALPAATVSVTEQATGLARTFSTDSKGTYTVSGLTPGVYRVSVSAPGFESFTANNVKVAPSANTRVDAAMQVGSVSQTVSVSAAAQTLQTDSAEVRSDISSAQLSGFPVPASRNYESALILVPGVSPPANMHSLSANPGRGLFFSTNGAFGNANNIRIDGASAMNVWLPHVAAYQPGLDAIDSVNVTTNSYDAQEGLAGGASVNVHVKTGGNKFHGSLFEYHTDNALTAKPFFLPALFTRNPKTVDNTLGGTIGGPIRKDSLFFFFSYDGRRVSQTSSILTTVPTAAMRSGDFSGSSNPIYDPSTGTATGAGKTVFTGNQLPTARLDSIALTIQKSVPLPNLPNAGIANNYYATGPFTITNDKYDTDLTWKATSKLNLEARYGQLYFNDYDAPVWGTTGTYVNSAGGRQGKMYGDTYNGTISATYVFNQNLVYNGLFTATVMELYGDPVGIGTHVGTDLGIPGTDGPTNLYSGWPQFSISNFSVFGNPSAPVRFNNRDNQFQHTFMWTYRSHTLAFGGNIEREILDFWQTTSGSAAGVFNFTGSGTVVAGGPGANAYNAYADFLLGVFSSGTAERLPYGDLKAKYFQYSLFAQDHWVISPRLSLSYGLRWDYFPIGGRDHRGYERYNLKNNTMMICGVAGNPHDCSYGMSKLDFSPSLGFSYRLTPTLVLRAGGGINRDPYPLASNRDLATNFPNDLNATLTSPTSTTASGTLKTGLPTVSTIDISSGTVPVPSSYTVISLLDHNTRDYVETWNLAVEKQWNSKISTQAVYVGSRQVKVPTKLNVNSGVPGGGTASEPLNVLFSRTGTTYVATPVGRNQYDGLQMQATERFGENYSLNLGYTWSKTFAMCCDSVAGETLTINAPGYLNLNRGLAVFDRTYVFTAAGAARLPFGKNQRLLTSGVPAAIAGGWQLTGVLEAYSGVPFTVSASGTSLNAPGSSQYADRIKNGSCILGGYHGPTASYVDPTCFAAVTTARFGNSGPDSMRGPGVKDLNATLQRTFNIRERAQLEIRGEAFNVTNTPHFSNPSANISNVSFNSDGSVKSLGGFGALTGVNSRDQEGIDQRFFRVGAHITF